MSNAETIPLATHRRREYRFGDFTLDLDGGCLRRGADEVTLRPKTFAVLVYLVERHGRLVTKTELIDAIWPNTAVTDNSLSHCLVEIRRALNDDAQQVVRTLSRRGYMFAAPVSALQAVDLTTDKQRRVLPGISMAEYEVSGDGTRVVFVRSDEDNRGIWLAHVDGRLAPVQLSNDSNNRAYFGPPGTIVFTAEEDQRRYLFRVREDGSGRQKIAEAPIVALKGVSQDRRWAVVWAVADESRQLVGYPLDGGQPVLICDHCADSDGGPAARGRTPQALSWSPGGEFLYLRLQHRVSRCTKAERPTFCGCLSPVVSRPASRVSHTSPRCPASQSFPTEGSSLVRARRFSPTRTATHRNIYRISIP